MSSCYLRTPIALVGFDTTVGRVMAVTSTSDNAHSSFLREPLDLLLRL